MTDHETRIREALEAGPTEGVWNWDCDPVKGDPLGRTRYRVTTVGKTITQVYYSSYEGGPTNAGQDAAFIAACNPSAIRALLADLDAMRADARRHAAFFTSGLPVCFEGQEYYSKADCDATIDAALKGAAHECR